MPVCLADNNEVFILTCCPQVQRQSCGSVKWDNGLVNSKLIVKDFLMEYVYKIHVSDTEL